MRPRISLISLHQSGGCFSESTQRNIGPTFLEKEVVMMERIEARSLCLVIGELFCKIRLDSGSTSTHMRGGNRHTLPGSWYVGPKRSCVRVAGFAPLPWSQRFPRFHPEV